MRNINIVGVDIGYGFTKVYGSGNLSRVFPSQVSGAKASGAFDSQEKAIIVNGHSYTVGDDIGTLGDHSVGRNFLGTAEYLALLGEALSSSKFPFHVLVLGLPPGMYNETRIKNLEKAITSAALSTQSGIIRIPQMIKFVPQGAGIYFDYISNLATGTEPPHDNTAVIDLGHYTLDMVLFSKKGTGKKEYVHGMGRSYPLGVSMLITEIKNKFAEVYGEFLNSNEKIMQLVRDGRYTHFGNTYTLDVKPIVDEYIHKNVFKAVEAYNKDLQANSNKTVDEVVIGGGGVQCLGNATGQAVVVKDPQMSNARGYYLYGARLAAEPVTLKVEDAPLHAVGGN